MTARTAAATLTAAFLAGLLLPAPAGPSEPLPGTPAATIGRQTAAPDPCPERTRDDPGACNPGRFTLPADAFGNALPTGRHLGIPA